MKSENATRLDRASLLAAKSAGDAEALDSIIIGRDVLELVSSAMYIDPMTVYREYIQNAADAIDDARREGTLQAGDEGLVEISIDPTARSIRIRDNGCGVPNALFGRRMTALGASRKRGTSARGFRGVGRLAGLGYAQELVFRSRTAGDEKVAELTWDCRRLKAGLRQAEGSLEDLVKSVATLRMKPAGEYPERFFEVELRGVIRLRSDSLMSPSAANDYLAQVAPVPFAPEFSFGAEIREALAPHVSLGELVIRIDGSDRPVYRPHRNTIADDGGRAVAFADLAILEISGIDGDLAAVAWVLHHEYEGALPNGTGVKGLRLRCGNVQVGEHALLEDLFPETRFNSWAVGEIHVVDRKIIPNGRRDHFDQNAHYHNLINQLAPMARDIAKRCRTSSVRRKWERDYEIAVQAVSESIDVVVQGSLKAEARQAVLESARQSLLKATRVAAMEALEDGFDRRQAEVATLRSRLASLEGAGNAGSAFDRLPAEERERYQTVFELIYECSTNRAAAKSLVDKIMMRLV